MFVRLFALNPPAPLSVNAPPTVRLFVSKETPPDELVMVKALLNELEPMFKFCATLPFNVTKAVPCVNVPLLMKSPPTVNVLFQVDPR